MTFTFKGIRIGTAYQDSRLSYCADDNTYTEIPAMKQAMACPIEWAPSNPEQSFDEFVRLLWGL
jgi:hypothetical protein